MHAVGFFLIRTLLPLGSYLLIIYHNYRVLNFFFFSPNWAETKKLNLDIKFFLF